MTNYYTIDLTIETDDLTKTEIKQELKNKLEKQVPEQNHDLVMISKVQEVTE